MLFHLWEMISQKLFFLLQNEFYKDERWKDHDSSFKIQWSKMNQEVCFAVHVAIIFQKFAFKINFLCENFFANYIFQIMNLIPRENFVPTLLAWCWHTSSPSCQHCRHDVNTKKKLFGWLKHSEKTNLFCSFLIHRAVPSNVTTAPARKHARTKSLLNLKTSYIPHFSCTENVLTIKCAHTAGIKTSRCCWQLVLALPSFVSALPPRWKHAVKLTQIDWKLTQVD